MRIGISTASFYNRFMIEDLPALYADWGVRNAEYFLNSFCEYEPVFVDLLARRTEENGITVCSVHPMSSMFEAQLFSMHPRQQQDAFRIYEKVLAAAKRLKAGRYCMHGAAHLSGAAKNLEIARIAPIFDDLCAMAESYGVRLTLENVSWAFFHEPEFGLELLDSMKYGGLHFTLDIKQAVRSGSDPFVFANTLGDRIDAVHCCDCRWENGKMRYLLPPRGGFDFAGLVRALQSRGFDGDVLLEVYSDTYASTDELRDSYYALESAVTR